MTLPSQVGKKYTGGYKVEGEIKRPHGSTKAILLQKIRFSDDQRIEYCFAYYTIARKGKVEVEGKWIFANRPLFKPPDILKSILDEARDQNWEGF